MTVAISRLPTFLILAASLASCAPRPHVTHLRPAVSGIIVEDGKPIPAVELFLSKSPGKNEPCNEAGEVVPVSPAGAFSWTPVEKYKLTESLINPTADRAQATVLCIRHPEKGALIGVAMFMKLDQPVSLRLVCDVAHPHKASVGPNTVSAFIGQSQYCETSTID